MKSMNDIGLSDVKAVMTKKGYPISPGIPPNIVGIRNGIRESNSYDDKCFVWWTDEKGEQVHTYSITTNPGFHYLQNPISGTDGTAILVPGFYNAWVLGMHRGNQFALIQQAGAVNVYRDNNKDRVLDYDPAKIQSGYFGIDLHHGSISDNDVVDRYSAGCQVWRYHEPHGWLMNEFKRLSLQYSFHRFSYALLQQEDFAS